MLDLRLWLRRCSAARAFPALVAIVFVVIQSRSGWQFEWGWGFSQASTATLLLSPLVAGLVAFDRSRRVAPTLQALAATTPRARFVTLALASWAWTLLAWGVGMAYVAVRVAHNGGAGWPDPWIFLEAPVVLLAAASFGLAWGSVFRSLSAGPTAAVVVYLCVILTAALGLPGPFTAGQATGSLIGMEQIPEVALSGVGLSLAVALGPSLWDAQRTVLAQRYLRIYTGMMTLS